MFMTGKPSDLPERLLPIGYVRSATQDRSPKTDGSRCYSRETHELKGQHALENRSSRRIFDRSRNEARVRFERAGHGPNPVGGNEAIGVGDQYDVSLRMIDPVRDRSFFVSTTQFGNLRRPQEPHHGFARAIDNAVDPLDGCILGVIVNYDYLHFFTRIGVGQNRLETSSDLRFLVSSGNDYGDGCRGAWGRAPSA